MYVPALGLPLASGLDHAARWVTFLLFQQKFYTLFALLFGVGIVGGVTWLQHGADDSDVVQERADRASVAEAKAAAWQLALPAGCSLDRSFLAA